MYESFFGLKDRPFELVPDPRFLFMSGPHKEALALLEYGIFSGNGLSMLTGEVGTGKTMLVRAALAAAADQAVRCVHLNTPRLGPVEFTRFLARSFGLSPEAGESVTLCHDELTQTLIASQRQNQRWALVIDEAQTVSDEILEEIRYLTNLETDTTKLLSVVLVGQPELSERLRNPALRHLRQRIALRCTLRALDLNETASYIATRIRVAGGRAIDVLSREAVTAIFDAAQGLPRAITVLCNNALIVGFAAGQRPVSLKIVHEVCKDFELTPAREQSEELPARPDKPGSNTRLAEEVAGDRQLDSPQNGPPSSESSGGLMFESLRKPLGFFVRAERS